jgi:hypothetical protein
MNEQNRADSSSPVPQAGSSDEENEGSQAQKNVSHEESGTWKAGSTQEDEDEGRFGCTLEELRTRLQNVDWKIRRELLCMIREVAKKGDRRVCFKKISACNRWLNVNQNSIKICRHWFRHTRAMVLPMMRSNAHLIFFMALEHANRSE